MGAQKLEAAREAGAPGVDAQHLLVQMVEAGAGGGQPVLVDAHVAHVRVLAGDVGGGGQGEAHVEEMVLDAELARAQ